MGVALEYLDFEHCKRWLKSKLGAMLRAMPYRQIRAIFERRCLEAGVPLRYVPPKYSSLLGALLSVRWPMLGRDQAAAAVISLRASATGNPWLEMACAQAAKAERLRLRLNRKGHLDTRSRCWPHRRNGRRTVDLRARWTARATR